MISEIVVCDQCGKQQALGLVVGWFEVSRIGVDVTVHGEKPWPRHLCSVACLRRMLDMPDA